jgi:sulfotransferase 6B1
MTPAAKPSPLHKVRTAVWGPLSTRVRGNQLLRKPAIAGYRAVARTVLVSDPPKVLANSIPKAGTHLLTQLLGGVDKLWFSGLHVIDKNFWAGSVPDTEAYAPVDDALFRKRMRRVRNGQFLTAHLTGQPVTIRALDDLGFAPLLMIRDPRDIAVSLAFWYGTNPRLYTWERFSAMSSDEERLMAAIIGLPGGNGQQPVPSIGERLRRFQPWLTEPGTCVVRFEQLVGAAGGGTDEAQFDAVRRVLQHCRREASENRTAELARSVFAPHSKTFRRGAIATWPEHFTDEHRAAFAEVAGPELAAYGYA